MDGVGDIVRQLEQRRESIERALAALRGMDSRAAPGGKRPGRPPGKKFSAAARKRMSEAQKRRYAEQRAAEAGGSKKAGAPAKKKRAKRYISPEGNARIAEAARKMWAKRKRASK